MSLRDRGGRHLLADIPCLRVSLWRDGIAFALTDVGGSSLGISAVADALVVPAPARSEGLPGQPQRLLLPAPVDLVQTVVSQSFCLKLFFK